MINIPRSTPDFVHPKLKIIGLGGAGCNALDRIVLDGLQGAELVAINTDMQALTGSVAPVRMQIGQTVTRGLGTGGDPELGRRAAEECSAELEKTVAESTIIFVLAGLGGGTASGALPILADLAAEQNAFVVVLGTLPFAFEGQRRAEQAAEALKAVRGMADLVICFENEKMADMVAPHASIQEAFATADQTLSQCVRAMAAMVHRRGLLKVGFDEIGSAIRGGARSFFGYGEATGDNRAHEAVAAAFKSPLLDHGRALKHADAVVVQLVGGTDFTLNELGIAMEEINRSLAEGAHLFMGTATDSQMNGKLSVAIFCGTGVESPLLELPARSGRIAQPASAIAGESSSHFSSVNGDVEHGEEVELDQSDEANEHLTRGKEDEEEIEEEGTEMDEAEEGDESEEGVEEEEEGTEQDDEEELEEDDDEAEEDGTGVAPAVAGSLPQRSPLPAGRPQPVRSVYSSLNARPAREGEGVSTPNSTGAVDRIRQQQMSFEPVNRGRFEKSEPTIIDGQDLDVPTFLRRKS